jgi:hypothetical protein
VPDFAFRRHLRTPYSEGYVVLDGDRPVGHVDIHFALETVRVTLTVSEAVTREEIQEIVELIDDDLASADGISCTSLVAHVFQGREAGVYSDHDLSDDDEDDW